MDIEKLYQDVWARVFAQSVLQVSPAAATLAANHAAKAAVECFNFSQAQAVIAAKAAAT